VTDLSELSISGRVATPDDPDWDDARRAWNLAVDLHPAAVATVESPDDVAKVVSFAAAQDLKVTALGAGHGADALGSLEGTILIKMERLRGVEIDGDTARVEPGVLALDLAEATTAHGKTFLPGSATNVSVVGFSLGGGLGWLGRKHGFACNRISAIEVVGADGEQRTVDAENEQDLFWALRGGGGGYAIVTAIHVDLLPISDAYAGALLFPGEVGIDGLRAWRDWTAGLPEEVSAMFRFLRLPPVPEVPEPLRDTPLLYMGATCVGTQEEGESLIAPLREIGEPVMDTFEQMPCVGLCRIAMDPEDPVPYEGHGDVLAELPDEAVDAFYQAAGPESGSPLLLAELRTAGGALARPAENAGALEKLDAAYTFLGIGALMAPELAQPINARLSQIADAMDPWSAEGGYFNFAERPCDIDAILPPETCSRLSDVKRKWDPDDRIVANHAVSLATA
jgi:hypothetical protein